MRLRLIALAAALCWMTTSLRPARADEATPGKAGTYTTQFTRRSPLSKPGELAARLGQKKLDGDYDLGKQGMIVCVPEDYAAAKPMGLIVLINYKDATEPPEEVLPILKEKNLALVVLQQSDQEWWAKCGIALDVVDNMRSLYKIDPARVYVFGYDREADAIRLGVGSPDVFSGFVVTQALETWKPIRAANKGIYPPKLPAPPAKSIAAARAHPAVFCYTQDSEYADLVPKSYQADGFKSVKVMKLTLDDYHYPHYTTGWFAKSLQFLDQGAAERAPKASATRPAAPAKPAGR